VHFAPHCLVDVRELDCDFLSCSAYKFYGPHVGVFFAKHDLLTSLEFPKLDPAPDLPPERAETGTLNHEGIVGGAAAVEWLAGLAGGGDLRSSLVRVYQELERRSAELFALMWEGLGRVTGVTLFGPPPDAPRTPTVGFSVPGAAPVDVARALSGRGMFLSHGNFYALTVIEQLGLHPEGLVRAGLACYSTEEDVVRLVEGVKALAE
jgi:selenocysteine lyase/cysteine desulfurase